MGLSNCLRCLCHSVSAAPVASWRSFASFLTSFNFVLEDGKVSHPQFLAKVRLSKDCLQFVSYDSARSLAGAEPGAHLSDSGAKSDLGSELHMTSHSLRAGHFGPWISTLKRSISPSCGGVITPMSSSHTLGTTTGRATSIMAPSDVHCPTLLSPTKATCPSPMFFPISSQ